MRRCISSLIAVFLLLLLAAPSALPAGNSGFGLGVILGAPTGLSCKGWIGAHQAIDGAASWTTSRGDKSLYLHGDLLRQNHNALHLDPVWLDWHYGVGLAINFKEDTEMGLRIPVGLDYSLTTIPMELFVEIVPVLLLTPDSSFDIDGGIGLRIFF